MLVLIIVLTSTRCKHPDETFPLEPVVATEFVLLSNNRKFVQSHLFGKWRVPETLGSVVQRILFIVTGPKTEDIYVDKCVYGDNSVSVH